MGQVRAMHTRPDSDVGASVSWVAIFTALLLAVPALAMQFSDEVNWGPLDFALMGALLFGGGLAFVLLARRVPNHSYRLGVGIAVAAGLLLVWTSLAVGLIGAEDHPANLLYVAVLLTAGGGALVARFEPRGMSMAMLAAAGVHALVAVLALLLNLGTPGTSRWLLLAANGVFVVLFASSAMLFRRAAR
jgi:hypothetical protein